MITEKLAISLCFGFCFKMSEMLKSPTWNQKHTSVFFAKVFSIEQTNFAGAAVSRPTLGFFYVIFNLGGVSTNMTLTTYYIYRRNEDHGTLAKEALVLFSFLFGDINSSGNF